MKFIPTIILIAILATINTFSTTRLERTNKKSTRNSAALTKIKAQRLRDNGSGTWEKGYYLCRMLAIGKDEDFGDFESMAQGFFRPNDIEMSATAYNEAKIGWVFDFSEQKPEEDMVKIFTPVNATHSYLAYRLLSDSVQYAASAKGVKALMGWVTTDKKEIVHFKFHLPYNKDKPIITEVQSSKLATLLDQNRALHKSIVTTNKANFHKNCNDYITFKPLYDAASADATKFAQAKADQLKLNTTLTKELEDNTAKFNKNQKSIDDLTAQLQALKAAQTQLQSKMSATFSQIDTISRNLKNLENQGVSMANSANDFKLKFTAALSNIDIFAKNLKEEAPPRAQNIDNAKSCCTKNDKLCVNKELDSIYP